MELKNTTQAMQKLGSNVIKEGRRVLKRKKKTTSQNTLYKDFDYLVRKTPKGLELEFEFGGAEDYWAFVDEGVRGAGGFKGSGKMRGGNTKFRFGSGKFKGTWGKFRTAIDRWVVSKGLKATRDKSGRFVGRKSLVFLIQRAIYQKGLQRTQFFSKPFTEQLNKQTDAILDAFGNDLEKQLELVIGN